MKVSIILNTIDRFELMRYTVQSALLNTGWHDYEILVCNNGGTDPRVDQFFENLQPHPKHIIKNVENKGNYQMLNQMILKATGDFICVIDNDILLPQNWLQKLVLFNLAIPDAGVSGLHCVEALPDPIVKDGLPIHKVQRVYGIKFFNRKLFNKIGYFCEDYGKYGFGDSDFSVRSEFAGFTNYYVTDMQSIHAGADMGEDSEYRKMKSETLRSNKGKFEANCQKYRKDQYVGPPPVC